MGDDSGQSLAYVYFEDERGDGDEPKTLVGGGVTGAAKLLTKDEARRIAANIAKLPKPAATHNP